MHALDPRAKILGSTVLVVGLLFVDTFSGLLVFGLAVAVGAALSRVPARHLAGTFRPVLPIVALTALFQVLAVREGEELLRWGVFAVHEGGIRLAALLSGRILLLVAAAALLTATTSPLAVADGIESLFSPLKRLRLPVHEAAMTMSIALRFLPTLQEEADRVRKAQAARGADFSEGGPVQRLRALAPILIPLTVGAFRRADALAEAMESRGYAGGEGRTRYRELRFGGRDALAVALAFLVAASGIPL
jgi:energy-coupling factor transport system permease protein